MLQNDPELLEFLSRDTYLTFVFYNFPGIKCGVYLAAIFDSGKWVRDKMDHDWWNKLTRWGKQGELKAMGKV